MKVALIGATGNAGSRILAELLSRGHEVTGIARHLETLSSQARLTKQQGDVNNEHGLAELLSGHDAVISALAPPLGEGQGFVAANRNLIAALKRAGVRRLVVVGGAGSLEVAPGVQVIDSPAFRALPEERKPGALAHREALGLLRESDLDWTYLSPPFLLVPGERTGKFRLGRDQLLLGDNGESKISFEDFAVALVDELETPRHSRQRFTVGY